MQAMPVTAAMPKTPGNTAQATGQGNEGAAAEGVDFSVLLLTQIKDGKGVAAKVEVLLDAGTVEPALAGTEKQQDPASLSGADAALNGGLLPLAGVLMALPATVTQQPEPSALLAAASGKKLEGVKSDPDIVARFDRDRLGVKAAAMDSGQVAEFAVDGKMLPENRVDKNADVPNLPVMSAESRHMPDVPASLQPAMMAANHASVTESRPVAASSATLPTPVGAAGWGDALGQKVVWMAGQQTQVAELHLNPPHLGPMEVRLSINNDQISALFVSHQPAVREALEAAMPRLREMFADSGMTLGNAMVGSDSLPQQPSGHEGQSGSSRQPGFSGMGGMLPALGREGMIPLRHDGSGMVDLFA